MRWHRHNLSFHRLLGIQHERTRHKVNRRKESGYWLARISEQAGQRRKLWRASSAIMGLVRVVVKEGPSAPSLLDFVFQTIETIRQSQSCPRVEWTRFRVMNLPDLGGSGQHSVFFIFLLIIF